MLCQARGRALQLHQGVVVQAEGQALWGEDRAGGAHGRFDFGRPLGCAAPVHRVDRARVVAKVDEVVVADGPTNSALDWIGISKDKRGFVSASSGRRFIPWGFNYDRDYKMRLLEDYWEADWPTVVEDFREMKQLGANVVRVHLQFAKFMDAPDRPNEGALGRLGRLVALAEETGLYLDLTGLGCYRKGDVPAWYSSQDETERWEAQTRFWEAVAGRCAGSPAIFCYDLMNEPIVPGGKRKPGDWLTGELGGFNYCQFISLDQAGRPRPEIARRWVARLVAAIRKHDPRHLITVGLLPNSLEGAAWSSGFVPRKIAGHLDFICVHLYPRRVGWRRT